MGHITNLPAELRMLIFDFLQGQLHSQKTLYNMCLVSKHFLPDARHALYAAPEAHWLTYDYLWIFTDRLFVPLIKCPKLGPKVRRLDLHVPTTRPQPKHVYLKFVNHIARKEPYRSRIVAHWDLKHWVGLVLSLVPKLEVLEISGGVSGNSGEPSLGPGLLFDWAPTEGSEARFRFFNSIHTLKLWDVKPRASWLALPRLQTLEVDAKFYMPYLAKVPNLEVKKLTIHFMKEMFLTSSIGVELASRARRARFIELIEKCTKLKHFRLYYQENSGANVRLWTGFDWGWKHLCRKLVAAASTLEILDLTNPAQATAMSRR
jgi:hypothetical protein